MCDPPGVGAKMRRLAQLGQIEGARTTLPLRIASDGDDHRSVGGRKQLVRHEVRMGIPPAASLRTGHHHILRDVDECGNRAVDERNHYSPPHARSSTSDQRGEYGNGRILSRYHVCQRYPRLHWLTIRLSGDRHPPSLCLNNHIVSRARAFGAESGDRAPDQVRMLLNQRVGVQPEPAESSRPEVVDHDVGRSGELTNELSPVGICQIDGDTALVPVDAQKVSAHLVVIERRAPPAGLVAVFGAFDFQNIRAEVAEHHRAQRSGQHSTQVENANSS